MTKARSGRSLTVSALGVLAAGIGVVLTVAFIAPLHSELRLPVFPQDEGLLLVYPSLILRGAIPNHTFDSVYGVTNLWIIAAAFKLFGYGVTVERGVGIAYRAVMLGSLVILAWRRRGPMAATVAGAICIVLLTGTLGLAAFGWMCALALASFGLLMLDVGLNGSIRRIPVAVAGISFGLAVGTRLDMALAVLLAVVALLVTWRICRPWLLLGLLVGLIPLAVSIAQAGLQAVVRDQLTDPIFVSGPARHLPLSTLTWQEMTLLTLCVLVAFSSTLVGVVRVRRDRTEWDAVLLLSLGLFEVAILPQAFQRSDSLHLSLVACFVLPAAAMLPAWHVRRVAALENLNYLPVGIGIVVLLLAAPSYGQMYWSGANPRSAQVPVNRVSNEGRSVPVGSVEDEKNLTELLKVVDARAQPGQRIFVGPLDLRTADYSDTFIYFLLPRLIPGSYYLEMDPGVANGKNSQLASDLRGDDFLILTNRYDHMFDPDPGTRFGSNAPNEVVASSFQEVDSRGPWVLYERR